MLSYFLLLLLYFIFSIYLFFLFFSLLSPLPTSCPFLPPHSHAHCILTPNIFIGEYEETFGTCLVFSQGRKFIVDCNQASANEVKPIASLQKILRFRLLHEGDVQDATSEPVDI
ncbi:hypothetical protein PVL29_025409 [Vitis rotundifolia]|uniref:Transcription factor TFIIIC triple barrel domain-containing protein n=1 Tax=Vitis rotundifolia TaxID=103349 RepID=A0AA38YJN6_VITRO|nr:hypothetical protein PVL29_025409 [Vitis rotundifolia]